MQRKWKRNADSTTILHDDYDGKRTTPYTWIYRWKNENEFSHTLKDTHISDYKSAIKFKQNEQHKYFQKICENRPHIIIYHKAGYSKLKNCSDVDHYHMITWHAAHPTAEHSFLTLKRLLMERSEKPYNINCPKVYNPYGLALYFNKDPETRTAIAAGNIKSIGQKTMLRKITDKDYEEATASDEEEELAGKANTLRGKKYDFIIKMMRKCNSTDIGDVMVYCKNSNKESVQEIWANIFRNTANLQNIIQAAASDLNIQTKVTPIYEQIRQKSDFFTSESNRYWDVQKSLDIYTKHGVITITSTQTISVLNFSKSATKSDRKLMDYISLEYQTVANRIYYGRYEMGS